MAGKGIGRPLPGTQSRVTANGTDPPTISLRKDFFPYLVQVETLSTDALEFYAPVGQNLTKRPVVVQGTMSNDLNGAGGVVELSIDVDPAVLKRERGLEPFLIVHFSI